jgi:hypothetical protein
MTKAQKSRKSKKSSSPDKLVKTGKKGEVELTEDELKRVSGGGAIKFSGVTTGYKGWID